MRFGWVFGRPARAAFALAVTVVATGCDRRRDDVPVVVSVIADREGTRLAPGKRVLASATAQGLVRFDAFGGVEPGLAERWIVIDDGLSYIFRLRDGAWPDGRAITSAQVVPVLRRAIARGPLAPYLTAIGEVVAMTPQVIEVRLRRPRPDLLKLFAQPELTIPAPGFGVGGGPFRVERITPAGTLLRPGVDPALAGDDAPEAPAPETFVRVREERASAAILRFAAKRSDLVEGGGFVDWPLVEIGGVAPANIRLDGSAGLFGFAFAARDGVLADPANREAVAMALSAANLPGGLRDGWLAQDTVLPDRFDSTLPPAAPAWASVPPADRQATAEARIAVWVAANPAPVTMRVALPTGPGANRLYGLVAAALRRLGLAPERVGWHAPAELRLVDAVAPYDSARWYLRNACQPCGSDAAQAIAAARDAPTLAERARRIADADAALAADVAFVPLAAPLRWSLVAQRLRAWTPNARAWHPLNHLRRDTN